MEGPNDAVISDEIEPSGDDPQELQPPHRNLYSYFGLWASKNDYMGEDLNVPVGHNPGCFQVIYVHLQQYFQRLGRRVRTFVRGHSYDEYNYDLDEARHQCQLDSTS